MEYVRCCSWWTQTLDTVSHLFLNRLRDFVKVEKEKAVLVDIDVESKTESKPVLLFTRSQVAVLIIGFALLALFAPLLRLNSGSTVTPHSPFCDPDEA